MRANVVIYCLSTFLLLNACSPAKKTQSSKIDRISTNTSSTKDLPAVNKNAEGVFLEEILAARPKLFAEILDKRHDLNVQIIYTQVDRNASNQPTFKNHYFNLSPDRYFYPASTVKLPIAALALQKVNELKNDKVDKHTTMITSAAYASQTEVFNDPTAADGRPSIAQYIRKIFLVSDNDAFNRLYEFLGQEYINEQLRKKGYDQAQILHRLSIFLKEDENRATNPVTFLDTANRTIVQMSLQQNKQKHVDRFDSLGKAFFSAGKLVEGPMDFSKKNKLTLEELHLMLRSIIFPASVPKKQRFNLNEDDYRFLHQYMSQYPAETVHPSYDHKEYRDSYAKFLFHGQLGDSLPKSLRIFNKVGDAYGHTLDAAYIVDFDKNVEFFLSAVIYANRDGVLNDDKYDYDSLAFPFMANLGKVIYEYETSRERKHIPDLSSFKIIYDK